MMYERYLDSARQVILNAEEEARRRKSLFVYPEHLLLGLFQEEEGFTVLVLRDLGTSDEEARLSLEASMAVGEETFSGRIPLSPRLKHVLEFAYRESLKLVKTYIGPEHLLLGLVRDNENLATQVLDGFGINYREVLARAEDPRFLEPTEAKTLLVVRSDLLRLIHSIGLHESIHGKMLSRPLMLLLRYLERKLKVIDEMLEELQEFKSA